MTGIAGTGTVCRCVMGRFNPSKAVSLAPEELGEVWEMIEEHITIEKRTLQLAQESLDSIGGAKGMLVQSYLLEYLVEDEKKHNVLLERLATIQKGMYPYG